MATRQRKATRQRQARPSGRVTPKGGPPKATAAKAVNANGSGRRRPLDPETPVNVGRRPSSLGFLVFVAVMWLAVGLILFLTLSTSWRLIPAIVAFGIGLLFLRGAVSTLLRRERRKSQ
jgi:hypothetical protein